MNARDIAVAAAPQITEAYFHDLLAGIDAQLAGGEFYTAYLAGETSEFVRMNRGKVRQPGTVTQAYLELDLGHGQRHATQRLALTGDPGEDRAAIAATLLALRTVIPFLADDPHLLYATEVHPTHTIKEARLPQAAAAVEAVLDAGRGLDLVGLYASGPVVRGFGNALGQRNWHQVATFNLQWSLYHRADKAVKSSLSGATWDGGALTTRMAEAQGQLEAIARPARSLAPGKYRTYLTPAAMEEIASMLHWGGFSARSLATHQSSLSRMRGADGVRLDPRVHMAEAIADGMAPAFQGAGFIRPDRVPLIDAGRLVGALTSPRTAREFGGDTNGANGGESPESFAMAGGDLAMHDALGALDTGLYVGNLWYLNYSDRPAARITGMTRFATFWVEGGRIVAPVDVLRFDDTLFRMFGPNLAALTRETELRLEPNTYGERMLTSVHVPGALLSEMTFTL